MSCIYFDNRPKIGDNNSIEYLDAQKLPIAGASSFKLEIEDSIRHVGNKSVGCEGKYCFALWNVDATNNADFLLQGCWEHPDRPDCNDQKCVARIPLNRRSMRNLTRFCCCHGDHCNKFVSDNIDASLTFTEQYKNIMGGEINMALTAHSSFIFISAGVISALLLATMAALIFYYWKRKSKSNEWKKIGEKDGRVDGGLVDIKLFTDWQLISRGRYGDVHRAKYLNNQFAVKTFFPNHENYYKNELWIYSQACLRHPNIVPFLGHFNSASSAVECLNGAQCGLLLQHAGCGSLVGLLRRETISWETLCRFACDVISAINCLHSEYTHNGELKRMFVHRDINSRNILVTSSMRAQLCDFGFATEVGSPHNHHNNNAGNLQPPVLLTHSNVGTIRYMAPEILEGCVNLGENRVSLKQVDIYAFALVLWEMTTRCHHLHSVVGELKLAYERELGEHPGREELYNLVVISKIRPTVKSDLLQQGFEVARRTMEECWDDDAEARLSSAAILHRLRQLVRPIASRQTSSRPITSRQPTVIANQIDDEGAEDCLSSASSRSPVSDISNSVSIAMETVATDVSMDGVTGDAHGLDRQVEVLRRAATKSDGNSSGIGGLSGESTLSFDRPPVIYHNHPSTHHHLHPTPTPDYNQCCDNNDDPNEYLNPVLLPVDLPFLISNEKVSTSKCNKDFNKKSKKSLFARIRNCIGK